MANINPRGPTTTTGKNTILGPTDGLTDPYNSFVGGGTGMSGNQVMGDTGLEGITGLIGASLPGNTGITGVTGIEGFTGISSSQGVTGFSGVTGLGSIGASGFSGATGISGPTGLQGSRGSTGIGGLTGVFGGATGFQGITGLIGNTGISLVGVTGLTGNTGLLGVTGLIGATGIPMNGVTGLQGITGIQGATGLLDMLTLDVQRQTTGVTLAYVLPADSLGVDNQHLEIIASGLSATDGSSTTIILELGGYPLFNGSISFAGGSDISLEGILIRVGRSLQESSIQVTYEDGSGTMQWNSITADLTLSQNLIASLTSAGTGHILYSLVARRLQQPS
jgi:hypothetical protein